MVVLGLNAGNDPNEDLQVFVEAFEISFPILLHASGAYSAYRLFGGASPFPRDYIVDREGRVAYAATEYEPEAMTAVIDDLLDGSSPATETPSPVQPRLEVQPNPFNPRTEISFQMPYDQSVTLDIHDTRGRLVRKLLSNHPARTGHNMVVWDGTGNSGQAVPSGVYLARLHWAEGRVSRKMTLVR